MTNTQPPTEYVPVTTDLTFTFTLEDRTPHAAVAKPGDEVKAEARGAQVLITAASIVVGHAPAGDAAKIIEALAEDPWFSFAGKIASSDESATTVTVTLVITVDVRELWQLDFPAPPVLAAAVGYEGRGRFVAVYWTPYGDEVMWSDGVRSTTGNWTAWLTFARHPTVAPHLEQFNLGGSDVEADHHLVIDTETGALYVGYAEDAQALLAAAWRHRTMPEPPPFLVALAGAGADDLEGEIGRMAAGDFSGWVEIAPPPPGAITALIERDTQLTGELKAWLDGETSDTPRKGVQ